jgi:hypothetical protein
MTSHVLSNREIDQHFRDHPLYGGCVCQDELPPLAGKFWIVNLERSSAPAGAVGHWIAVFDCRPRVVYEVDPMGEPDPPKAVLRRMRETGKRITTSSQRLQSFEQDSCGVYCVFVIEELLAGHSFADIVKRMLRAKRYAKNQAVAVAETGL